MKKFIKFFALFLALVMMTVSASACMGMGPFQRNKSQTADSASACMGMGNPFPIENDENEAVCFLFGKQQHFPVVHVDRFYKEIVNVCFNYGSVSFALMQGNPTIGDDITVDPPDVAVDREKRTQLARKKADEIVAAIESSTPEREQVDVLASIKLASDLLKSKTEPVRTLCIISNMLSTTGLLDFSTGELINQDIGFIIDQLNAAHAIPDLSFINEIRIYGFGQTCGSEQDNLTDDFKLKMKSLWLAIFEAAGCSKDKVLFDDTPLAAIEPSGYPKVASVPVEEITLDFATATPATESPISTPINLLEDIRFAKNTAEILNYEEAIQKLTEIASIIIQHPDSTFLILGGCAGDTSTEFASFGMQLSRDRANSIRSLMISQGVPEHQLVAIGMGSLCINHTDGLGTGSAGSVNRVCYILNSDTPTGQEIMKTWVPTN